MYLFIHLFMHVSICMYLYIAAFPPYRLSFWARAARERLTQRVEAAAGERAEVRFGLYTILP